MTRTEEAGPPLPAWIVAEQILWLRDRRGLDTTPFQLQKLIYIAHGWMLGLTGRPLIDNPILAWEYGPVVLDIYYRYRSFGADPITLPTVDRSEFLDDEQKAVISSVVEAYNLSFRELFRITHHASTPWSQVWSEKGRNSTISNDLIEAHYRSLSEEAQ